MNTVTGSMNASCQHCAQRAERGVSFGFFVLRCKECGALISSAESTPSPEILLAAGTTLRAERSQGNGLTCSVRTGGMLHGVLGVTLGSAVFAAACLNLLFLEGDQRIGTGYSVLAMLIFGLMAYAGLTQMFNRMTLGMADRKLSLRYGPLPWLTPAPVPIDAVSHLRVVTIRARSGTTYSLELARTDGAYQLLASSLAREGDATAIAAIANTMLAAMKAA